jgi:toxin-antitoxin system PIN domain toxin
VIVPDANLLIYAYDSASPFHSRSAAWWSTALSGAEPVGLTTPTVFAFIRLITNARVFERPLALDDAARHVHSWLGRKVTRMLPTPSTHVSDVLELLAAVGSSGGNLVTDAQITALARANNAVVHTADHDFRRFPGVRLHFPLDAR